MLLQAASVQGERFAAEVAARFWPGTRRPSSGA